MSIQRFTGGLPEKPPPVEQETLTLLRAAGAKEIQKNRTAKRLCLCLAGVGAVVGVTTYILTTVAFVPLLELKPPPPPDASSLPDNPMSVDGQDVPGWLPQPPPPKASDAVVDTKRYFYLASPLISGSIRMQTVDCTLPAAVWTDTLKLKLGTYAEQLTQRWSDEPDVRRELKKDFRTYQQKIRNNDGTRETCEKISQDLDDWMLPRMQWSPWMLPNWPLQRPIGEDANKGSREEGEDSPHKGGR